jgi:MraZ protein
LTTYKDHLALHPCEDWEMIERDLLSKPQLMPEVQDLTRFMITGASDCPIDSQGRILVPPTHREHAQLRNKVTVAGVLDRVEIWDTEMFDANRLRTKTNLTEIQVKVQEIAENTVI